MSIHPYSSWLIKDASRAGSDVDTHTHPVRMQSTPFQARSACEHLTLPILHSSPGLGLPVYKDAHGGWTCAHTLTPGPAAHHEGTFPTSPLSWNPAPAPKAPRVHLLLFILTAVQSLLFSHGAHGARRHSWLLSCFLLSIESP